jgi:hypothetical protein
MEGVARGPNSLLSFWKNYRRTPNNVFYGKDPKM